MKVKFNWQMYENAENSLFFYSITFIGHEGNTVGHVQNIQDHVFRQALFKGKYNLIKTREDDFALAQNEIISAIRLGMRKSTSIVCIQFLIS